MDAVTGRVLFVKSAVAHAHAKNTPVMDGRHQNNVYRLTAFFPPPGYALSARSMGACSQANEWSIGNVTIDPLRES